MAYLNEFPNWESNGRNLDWLLEQYSTFNERLQQIVDEFHESVQQMETDISNLESEYQRKLDTFEGRVLNEINTISNAIDQVSQNVSDYVSEHMNEWQLDAMTGDANDIIIGEFDPTQPITDGGNLNSIIINNERVLVGFDSYKVFYSTSIHKNQLEGFTQGQLITQVDRTMNPEFYNALAQIEEKMGEHFEDLYIPYNAILSGDSFSDDTEYNAIKNMGFRLGYMRPMRYDSNRIDVILNWARNANSTVGVTNGIYLMLNVQLPNL